MHEFEFMKIKVAIQRAEELNAEAQAIQVEIEFLEARRDGKDIPSIAFRGGYQSVYIRPSLAERFLDQAIDLLKKRRADVLCHVRQITCPPGTRQAD
jgi:hypothetical protein